MSDGQTDKEGTVLVTLHRSARPGSETRVSRDTAQGRGNACGALRVGIFPRAHARTPVSSDKGPPLLSPESRSVDALSVPTALGLRIELPILSTFHNRLKCPKSHRIFSRCLGRRGGLFYENAWRMCSSVVCVGFSGDGPALGLLAPSHFSFHVAEMLAPR